MTDKKSTLEDVIGKLKQERDELKLQMHLASMDAKDEYDRIAGKIDELNDQFEPVKDALEETAGNIWSALELAGSELLAGIGRVRKAVEGDEGEQ